MQDSPRTVSPKDLRLVTVVGRGAALVWTWARSELEVDGWSDGVMPPLKAQKASDGDWIVASDPKLVLLPNGELAPRGRNKELSYGREIRGCLNGGEHRAVLLLGKQQVPDHAVWSWSRRARCSVCRVSIPASHGNNGRLVQDLHLWSTPSGSLEVGDCYEVVNKDIPMSKQSASAGRKKHVVVVLPGLVKAAITAPRSESTMDGWSVVGELPTITVTPEIDVGSWRGSITNGVFEL